jgi:hypothetical protein
MITLLTEEPKAELLDHAPRGRVHRDAANRNFAQRESLEALTKHLSGRFRDKATVLKRRADPIPKLGSIHSPCPKLTADAMKANDTDDVIMLAEREGEIRPTLTGFTHGRDECGRLFGGRVRLPVHEARKSHIGYERPEGGHVFRCEWAKEKPLGSELGAGLHALQLYDPHRRSVAALSLGE